MTQTMLADPRSADSASDSTSSAAAAETVLADTDQPPVSRTVEPVRILVVDGDPHAVAHCRSVLEGEGYRTRGAHCGVQALTLTSGWLPHLVLLGWELPDLDGREVCRRIKAGMGLPGCLVVIASAGHPTGADQVAGLESGADGYLVRPISDRELIAWVQAFVRALRVNLELRAQVERGRILAQSLREREAQYRLLAERSVQVAWTLNVRTLRFLDVSPGVERLRGYTAEETMARPVQSLLPPRTWWSLRRLVRRWAVAYRSGETPPERFYTAEIELPCKGGGTVWTETVASFDRDPRTGNAVLHGVTRDIGERKAAQAALAESHRRLTLLMDSLPGFAYRCRNDPGRTIEFASGGCFALTGYSAEDLTSPAGNWYARIVHPDDRERVRDSVQSALAVHGSYDLEYRIVTASGAQRWVWEGGRGVYGALGGLVASEGLVLDIDPRRRAEAQVRELHGELERRVCERTAALEAANAELESFSYSVSHDLRAPLRAICGFARILGRRYRDRLDRDGRHYVDSVVAAGERMGALIEDLLSYARTGRGAARAVPVTLGPLTAELADIFGERLAACGGELQIKHPLATPLGDPTLIGQILDNLVENALVYRRSETPPRIVLSALREGNEVVLRVTDNGIGIAPEDQRRIFQVFLRLHGEDAYPGSGIGLAIVSKAARMLGGQVDVSSALGRGSTFSVRLPAAPAAPEGEGE